MGALLNHPVSRLLATTAAVGSAADWVLFATLVVTVDDLLAGSVWATAIVLVTRILPGVLFAPLAARRIDRADLAASLRRFEAVRVAAVAGLATAAALGSLGLAALSLAALEFAAAMQAAGRESVTSRHVPRDLFVRLNTVTAVLSYGLLPIGAAFVAWLGAGAGWAAALTGYGIIAARYARLRLPESDAATAPTRLATPVAATGGAPTESSPDLAGAAPSAGNGSRGWLRVTAAAALGLVPAVALFAVAPDLAGSWLGDRSLTAPLYGLVLVGGAGGFWAANTIRPPASVGMLLATAGGLAAAAGAWPFGLLVLGLGAGMAYLDLQHRLQTAASDPSQFATAFAILKVTAGLSVLAAPALGAAAGLPVALSAVSLCALLGAAVATPTSGRWLQILVREAIGVVFRRVVRVQITNPTARVDGPAVVVSNHPHWLDGAVAVQADRTLRPVARWQPRPDARFAIWAGNAVVTTAGTDQDRRPAYLQAADHLRRGGRIWLAPEGGSHQDAMLRSPRSGAVRMAHAAEVPLQPLGIRWEHGDGTRPGRWRPWRRLRATLTWGAPITATGAVEHDNDRMMHALAAASGMAWLTSIEHAA